MITQTVMDSINIFIDDTDDFSEYSKEVEITLPDSQLVNSSDHTINDSFDDTDESTPEFTLQILTQWKNLYKILMFNVNLPLVRLTITQLIGDLEESIVTSCRMTDNIAYS